MVQFMQVVVATATTVSIVLLIITMQVNTSVFTVDSGHGGCGVFECKGGGYTKDYYGKIGELFQAAQAFGIMTILIEAAVLACHALQFVGKMPSTMAGYLRIVHCVAALFAGLFWTLLTSAYTTKVHGVSLSDNNDVSFAIFFGVIVFVLEIAVVIIYPKTGWASSYRSI